MVSGKNRISAPERVKNLAILLICSLWNVLFRATQTMFFAMYLLISVAGANSNNPRNDEKFRLMESGSGQPMCPLDQPSYVVEHVNSKIECCMRCLQNVDCQAINFLADVGRCEMFEFPVKMTSESESRAENCHLAVVRLNSS